MSKQKLSPEAQAIISSIDARHYATTIELVNKFLEKNPASQRAWLDLGEALGALSRFEEAEMAYQKVIELAGESESSIVMGEIGNLYRAKGDFESARQWYQKQIDTDANDATGLLYLGNLQMRMGQLEAAELSFQKALECELVCLEETHFALGLAYRGLGRLQDAKVQFEQAIAIDPKMIDAKAALKDVAHAINLN